MEKAMACNIVKEKRKKPTPSAYIFDIVRAKYNKKMFCSKKRDANRIRPAVCVDLISP
jgi:hypothetical protein